MRRARHRGVDEWGGHAGTQGGPGEGAVKMNRGGVVTE